ncbi:hypothetical protein CVIRNUC_008324 [Coccomyxa viridis]|uniref:Uncharacterized protein n=1 Tax=Coccomyxa viridis TaxID=1274662 RepID=A0AAV1ICP3_9CHLO|nr:hypothetical protein CVIRNUC_008324 [Coccomyxa viridis]
MQKLCQLTARQIQFRSWPPVSSPGLSVQDTRRLHPVRCSLGTAFSKQQICIQRRHLLMLPAACSLLLAAQQSQAAFADEAIKLPKGYEEFAGKLIGALQDAIEADLSDMEERQVRRKADPAKNLVKSWIQDWKDVSDVQQEISHKELSGVIRQLGDFYKKQGQRSRLPRSVGEGLLAKLGAAQNALPLPAAADGKQKA